MAGNLAQIVAANRHFGRDYGACLGESFLELDAQLRATGTARESGACLCCCLVTPTHLFVANVGDCRMVLFNNRIGEESSFPVTKDHKASDPTESKRVKDAGGFVVRGRVFGMLAVSRVRANAGSCTACVPLDDFLASSDGPRCITVVGNRGFRVQRL